MYDTSISIVTYNNESLIEKTLTSIISHMSPGLKYIIYVIDNNSTDNTVDRVNNVVGNIVLIKNGKNIGFGAGHNTVLDKLDSKYHIVVNPDITIVNNAISEMFEYMDANPQISLLSPLIKSPNGQIQYLCKRNPTLIDLLIRLVFSDFFKERQDYYTMRETNYDHVFEFDYASGCFMFFRTEVFKKLNGFDANIFLYLEDADITRRVNQISKTVFYPYNYVVHEWQRGAYKDLRLMWINVQSAAYYFRKWGFRLY